MLLQMFYDHMTRCDHTSHQCFTSHRLMFTTNIIVAFYSYIVCVCVYVVPEEDDTNKKY